MFNSLASYILGNGNRNPANISPDEQNFSDTNVDTINNFKFISTNADGDDDDEWLLVEKGEGDSTPQQTDSEEEIPFVEIKNNPGAIRTRHSRSNSNVGSQDGMYNVLPSSPVPTSMDESWFVTPPPCFTSTGPVNVEMSPLENLLIEHPSMSVYHDICGIRDDDDVNQYGGMVVVNMDETPNEIPIEIVDRNEVEIIHPASERESGQTTRAVRNRAENHVNNLTTQQLKQVVAMKQSQKSHEKKNRQQICRNAIERGNKVREVNGKGGRQKRSDMTHCKVISRANNNRKC